MKFKDYLKDKTIHILLSLFTLIILILIFRLSNINKTIIIVFCIVLISLGLIFIIYDYFRKYNFYNKLFDNIKRLDQAYLVHSLIEKPDFYDGKLLYEIIYEVNKSMTENVNNLKIQNNDFKDYIEMWIHEVKIPLSSLSLILHNHKSNYNKSIMEQLKRINDYLEQILYYSRSENAEQDYLISSVNLNDIINKIALKNKDDILNNNINLIVDKINTKVRTDSKWLEFILNQIINNAIKYKKDSNESYIKIYTENIDNKINLYIEDNGIGIPKEDIKRVFNKSFTGYNGRVKSKSTGMGLYIAKKLCSKLGHDITIESEKDKYTTVCITFKKNNFYDVLS